MSIVLTSRAAEEIKKVREEQKLPVETPLRVGVKGGGCSGFSYFMGFEPNVREDDQAFQVDGVKVVVDSKSLSYLSGIELDFNEDVLNRGFVFKNPNAKSTCGCGHSFTV
ncbi:MAG: iron-sulfur cluster assembly accessory protein [Firmicutes bacterium]|jgi:iron-sulfur cluster assembly protein|nr:iron-sulfur cluster assembly accessory protein [Bacillota bacterium]